jgi:RNA polymerase sigma factor (sigma-70 family)
MARADGPTIYNHLRRILCAGALAGAADEDLLAQFIARRDEAAFAALLRRHGPMVWGVCRRLLTRAEDAEDAFQATFLILARRADSLQRRELLANWLFGVARRSALTMRAKAARRARQERSCHEVPEVPTPPVVPWDDVRAVVDEELARMPTKYRLPLLLCALEGMTQAEAGKSLGWPTGTVSARLSRGRQLLRTRLARRGVTAPATALVAVLGAAGLPQRATAAVCGAVAAIAGSETAARLSPAVALLLRQGLRTMALSRWLPAVALVTVLAVALGGAGVAWRLTRPAAPVPDAPVALAQEPPPAAAERATPPDALVATPCAIGQPAVRLPADPDVVVLRMDRSIGLAGRPAAALTIYADGRVIAEVPEGLFSLAPDDLTRYAQAAAAVQVPGAIPGSRKTTLLSGRLSATELDDLLRFAVRDQEFFDFDAPAVQEAIRQKYHPDDDDPPDPHDATTTRFHVHTADGIKEVEWLRLGRAAWTFPEVRRLLQLYALDRRLQQVFYVLLAGGPERVKAVAAKMNWFAQPYYDYYVNAPRLTAADLFSVTRAKDGSSMRFTFSRNKSNEFVRDPLLEIAIDVPLVGEPTFGYAMVSETLVPRRPASPGR